MSTPVLEIEEGKHWTRVGLPIKKGDREIYSFKCHICNNVFKNHRNAKAHCLQCLAQRRISDKQTTLDSLIITSKDEEVHVEKKTEIIEDIEPPIQEPLEKKTKALVELICDMNIPYTQLQSPSWNNFVKALCEDYKIPSSDEIKKAIIQYSKYICHHTLKDLKNMTVGLAIDGASFRKEHYYALILISSSKVRLLDIVNVEDQKGSTIAKVLLNCYKLCKRYDISIAGVVSDNAASLKAAISGDHPLYLPTLLGEAVIRVACGAHTAQLVISDITKNCEDFKIFVEELLGLVSYIRNREIDFKENCPCKIPEYICTRWNTLCDVLEFVLNHEENINVFIQEKTKEEDECYHQKMKKYENLIASGKTAKIPPVPDVPSVRTIPEEWFHIFEPLNAIRKFTTQIEGDLIMQYHLFLSYHETVQTLEELSSAGPIEKYFYDFFVERFNTTAQILIAKLSYIFTSEGIQFYRASPMEDREKITDLLNELAKSVFTEEEYSKSFIIASFDEYIDHVDFPARSSERFWKVMETRSFSKPDLNGGNEISFVYLAKIARILINLPATEAITERCFSALKRILSDYNGSMKKETFLAISMVKMALRYKRRYN